MIPHQGFWSVDKNFEFAQIFALEYLIFAVHLLTAYDVEILYSFKAVFPEPIYNTEANIL